jgi:hypothetical protein
MQLLPLSELKLAKAPITFGINHKPFSIAVKVLHDMVSAYFLALPLTVFHTSLDSSSVKNLSVSLSIFESAFALPSSVTT